MRFIIGLFLSIVMVVAVNASNMNRVLAAQSDPIIIGLDADMSAGAAQGGEAIRRGALIAIKEINEGGGVLGRKLELIVRDHRGNPARGVDNILEYAAMENVAAVLGGIHTPVVLKELKEIHANKMIFLVPWAAGTPIITNGYNPNYVFRVSVRDAFAGGFMVNHAIQSGYQKIGLLFEKTGWGRSNEKAVKSALSKLNMKPVGLEWFNWGVKDLSPEIESLYKQGAETIVIVANPREGSVIVKSMASRPKNQRLPIISHWGITGGNFFTANRENLKRVKLSFLQTFSFLSPPVIDRAQSFFTAYQQNFPDVIRVEDVLSPVGSVHAYDLIHLLAKAIANAGTDDRKLVRDALEQIDAHEGLMKTYSPPFTTERHDALDASNFIMAEFDDDGVIRPVGMKN